MRSIRVLIVAAIASVLLASCATTTHPLSSGPTITGTPTLNINNALTNVACTTASCIAVNTSQYGASEQYSDSSKAWTALSVPANALQITASSCWSTGCLLSGSTSTSQFLWKYSSGVVSTLKMPTMFQTISSLNCFADSECAAIGFDPSTSSLELIFSRDSAATWSTPSTLPSTFSAGGQISMSCSDAANCLVSGTAKSGPTVLLYATHDSGATWVQRTLRTTWQELRSLTCSALNCVGAMTDSSGSSFIVRTKTFGRIWEKVSSSKGGVTAMACAGVNKCVAIGMAKMNTPWVETLKNNVLLVNKLIYVATPFNGVACLPTKCVLVGNTSVAIVALNS